MLNHKYPKNTLKKERGLILELLDKKTYLYVKLMTVIDNFDNYNSLT